MGALTVVRLALALNLFIVRSAEGTGTCGERKLVATALIAHGYNTRAGAWPWHGAMFHKYNHGWTKYVCGVTILTEQIVLTAAHCTYEGRQRLPADRVFVKVGFSNMDLPEDHVRQFNVDRITRHEEYSMDTFENDIALLKLSCEITYTIYIQPVCLWKGDTQLSKIISKIGYTVGWGLDEGYNTPKKLSEATMPIVSSKKCWESDRRHYNKYYFESKTFCAGRRNGTHVKPGDSGGGLYMRMGSNWVLRGLVSNAIMNPATLEIRADSYAIFTDVAYYSNWIKTKVSDIPYFAVDTERIIGIDSDNQGNLLDLSNCGKDTYPLGTSEEEKGYINQYPWLAVISDPERKRYKKFGILIHPSFLITTASGSDISPWIVEFPLYVSIGNDDGRLQNSSEKILVRDIFPHPDYNTPEHANDIALFKLERPTTVNPICLPSWDPFHLPGATQFHVVVVDVNYELENFRKVAQLFDMMDCTENLHQIFNMTNGQVCSQVDSIIKDSYSYRYASAPLQYVKNGPFESQYFLTGIASVEVNFYNIVYTKVSSYSKWIREKIRQN